MKKYTLQQCIDDNIVIFCKTKEQAEAYCKAMHELGRKWYASQSYLDKNYWIDNYRKIWYIPWWDMYTRSLANIEQRVITFNRLDLESKKEDK